MEYLPAAVLAGTLILTSHVSVARPATVNAEEPRITVHPEGALMAGLKFSSWSVLFVTRTGAVTVPPASAVTGPPLILLMPKDVEGVCPHKREPPATVVTISKAAAAFSFTVLELQTVLSRRDFVVTRVSENDSSV